jgi:hypothetical protein
MSGSVRTRLTVGIAAITASAVVLAPTTTPTPRPDAQELSAPRVALTAAVKPLVVTPLTPKQLDTARAVIGRLDPKAASLLPQAAPAPLNAASNSITSAYEWLKGWVSYGVDLAQYALQFIPYGYLIGNQIGIVYDTLVLPISDSVVYGLIIPVVNDPLNLASYVNGAVAVGSTTVNSFINFGIAEFNYFFGWLIPPLPPLPLAATEATTLTALKLTAEPTAESVEPAIGTTDDTTVLATQEATVTDVVDADAPTAAEPADQAEPAESGTLPTPTEAETAAEPASAESPEGDEVEAGTEPVTSKPETEPEKATGTTTTATTTATSSASSTSSNGVAAQGEVRGGTDGSPGAKPAEDTKPDATKGKEGKDGKDGKDTVSPAGKPGASAAGGVEKTGKGTHERTHDDAVKDAEKANG